MATPRWSCPRDAKVIADALQLREKIGTFCRCRWAKLTNKFRGGKAVLAKMLIRHDQITLFLAGKERDHVPFRKHTENNIEGGSLRHQPKPTTMRVKIEDLRALCPGLLDDPERSLARPILDDGLLVNEVVWWMPTVRVRARG